jgi:hypothetical protein
VKKYVLFIAVLMILFSIPVLAQWTQVNPVTTTATSSTGTQITCPANACTVLVPAEQRGQRRSVTMQSMGANVVLVTPNNTACTTANSGMALTQYMAYTDDQGVDAWYCRGLVADASMGVTIRR